MSKEGMVETIRALDIESSRLTALILKRDATIEDLKDALDAMFNQRCERDATIERLTTGRDEALAGIERVWALHFSEDNDRDAEWCVHDSETWPCSTIRALRATS